MADKNPFPRKNKSEGNLFDKIVKENAENIFRPLVEKHLRERIIHFQGVKEKMQTTIEREMDFFYEVETDQGNRFVLHLEFQAENDVEMLYRGAEYHGMALRRKQMSMKHIVIYLGEKPPTMPTALPKDQQYQGFELIDIHQLDTEELLSSQVPEVVLLAILSNYPKKQVEEVLRLTISQLRTVCKNQNKLSKHLQQLMVLARLRKLEELTIKIVETMPITFDITKDVFYQQGIMAERARGEKEKEKLALKVEKAEKEKERLLLKAEKEKQRLKIQTARVMLLDKMKVEAVAKYLDLTLEEVFQLQKSLKAGDQ